VLEEAQLSPGPDDAVQLGERSTRVGHRAENQGHDARVECRTFRGDALRVPATTSTGMGARLALTFAQERR
jgi:hypothetical protein